MKIQKILIANRGEIAVRILRTCKELGIDTVSVHSQIDQDCLHVKFADESVCIGPNKSALSYLNIPAILSAAEITCAQAVHPGFGFLSENYEFAKHCTDWNLVFIGPSPEVIRKMGDKIQSKKIAEEAGLPVLKPVTVKNKSDNKILEEVEKLGLPVLIKSSAGGGGKGMKRIDRISDLLSSLKVLQNEAKSAFGDDTVFVEKYITSPRHVEVQILGDKHGHVVHLGERDCTVQRRFQKVIEESPCPVLTPAIRQEICESAVRLGKYVGYDSVGTVEFLYDQDSNQFYFMEMNTRIQVEHPVTEQRTTVDLIAEQIKVAQGIPLGFTQDEIIFVGHSMECRINAEDPKTFTPAPGKIQYYYRPAGPGVRVDDFIYSGYCVPPFYDSMLAKIIVYGRDREECLRRMHRALNEMVIEGIKTNITMHLEIIAHPLFRSNNYNTSFLAENLK